MCNYVLSILVLKVYSCVCISVLIYFELYNKSLSINILNTTGSSKHHCMRGSLGCRSQTQLPRLDQRLEMPQHSQSTARLYAVPFDHALLFVKRGLLQCTSTISCKTSCLLSGVKRCPLFRFIFVITIGGLAGAWVRCSLDGDVR